MIMVKTRECILFLSQHFSIKHEVFSLLLPTGFIYRSKIQIKVSVRNKVTKGLWQNLLVYCITTPPNTILFNYLLPKFLCSYSLEYIFSSVHFSVMRLAAGSTSPVLLSRALLQAV